MQDQKNKSTCVGLTMTMLVKMQISFLVNTKSIRHKRILTWLKEVHIIVLVPRGIILWQQKCRKLHHGFLYIHCYDLNVSGEYP